MDSIINLSSEDIQAMKDDNSPQAVAVYWVLFVCFFFLFVFGILLVVLMVRSNRFNKQMCAFYMSSLTVIMLRLLLFSDPLVKWSLNTYVIALVALPSYLYLIVGFSQVLLIFESIVSYRRTRILND